MNQTRLNKYEYFLRIAALVSTRGTCARRQTGCVLVNKHNHIIATGYNGVARGVFHCIDTPCAGALAKPGESLELCEAIHAEENALIQVADAQAIEIAYCTDSPCVGCMKKLMNTSVRRIFFSREYPHPRSMEMAASVGIEWARIQLEWPFILQEGFHR